MTRKSRLPSRVSLLALATVMVAGASPAAAQSFQGDGTFAHGTGSITTPDSVTTNISVTSPQAVIDWIPFADGGTSGQDIVFQAGLTTANFTSASDFAVLNRIDPGDMTRMIRMDGTITSKVDGVTGGSVYFYSPSGFVLGATSLIDVGSLVLTSRPITVDGNGNFINNGTVIFGEAPDPFGTPVNPAARIETHSLAQINALNEGSYVAMVAPRVQHHGSIDVNGGAALVGAEAATITFRPSGLFDIQVDVGTDDPNGVAVYGDINGPASSGSGDNHRVYLVAVPKNTALTMLVQQGADLGFDVAQSADVVGNTVVLSAGYSVFPESFEPFQPAASGAVANINIANANFTSALVGQATGNIDLTATAGQSAHLYSTADLTSAGGTIQVQAIGAGALINVDSDLTLTSNSVGLGSPEEGQPGGDATGGTLNITASDGGDIIVGGGLRAEANGTGGSQGYFGGIGGNGTGGTINVRALGAGSSISAGITELYAEGFGGTTSECTSCDIRGGIGHGGTINVQLDQGAAAMTFSRLYTWAIGHGGYGAGGDAGDGIGGDSALSIGGGSTLTINGNYLNFADGVGGDAEGSGAGGGGHGGSASLVSTTGGGQIFFKGSDSYITADAQGGTASGSGNGGNAFSGDATINVTNTAISVANAAQTQPFGRIYTKANAMGGASAGGAGGSADASTGDVSMTIGANSSLTAGRQILTLAEATGGNGTTGGAAEGGTATITVNSGGALTGEVNQFADATGGAGASGAGGNATGGTARLDIAGGTATITSHLGYAAAIGGNTGGVGSTGGAGQGGTVTVTGTSGSATFGTATLITNGQGGTAVNGTGGSGVGGVSIFNTDGATLLVNSNLTLTATSTGGAGIDGGDAIAFVGTNPKNTSTTSARVLAGNGTITVNGATLLDVSATGGAGSASGSGGDAGGGYATVFAKNSNAGPATITMAALTIDADATGGGGGDALVESGANGGAGGQASGGFIATTASAGNGHLDIGDALLTATATGGLGGDGDFTIDAVGGAGGDAYIIGRNGGQIYFGTEAGAAMTVLENNGTASFDSVTADVSMAGGDGGNAWLGTGGAGGDADGNAITDGGGIGIMVRGGTLTTGSIDATADAQGGNSGFGSGEVRNSTGGNALSGGLSLITDSRAGDDSMRGTLNAGSVNLHGAGTGGAGAVQGTGHTGGWSAVVVENSDITMDDFTLAYSGSSGGWPDALVDQYELFNSTFAVTNGFSIVDPTIVSFYLDNSSLTAGSFSIDAGDFIHDPFFPAPTAMGTITAGSISLISGNDIVLDANLVSTGFINLNAAGLVDLGDLEGGAIDVTAGETITLGTIDSADFVNVQAPGNITLGNIDAGSSISVESFTGTLALNDLSALTTIVLDAAGNIGFTDVTADDFDFSAGGDVNGGNILAGTGAYGDAEGAIDLGNISVGILMGGGATEDGFAVGFSSATSIHVLDVEADESIGFATLGNLTTGSLNSGADVLAMVGGDMNLGAITTPGTGRTYLADVSMFLNNGGPDDFDPAPVFAATPVRSGGAINIGGPVSTGRFQAAAGTTLTAQSIAAALGISLNAGGNISTAALNSGAAVDATSNGSIQTGNIDAATSVFGRAFTTFTAGTIDSGTFIDIRSNGLTSLGTLNAGDYIDLRTGGGIQLADATSGETIYILTGGTLNGGDLTAGNTVAAQGANGITLGNLSAGIVNPSSVTGARYAVGLGSNGAINVGNITAAGDIGMGTVGTVTTGNLISGGGILAIVGGNMQFGSMTTDADGYIYLADASMAALGGTFDNFDRGPVLAATPVATSGSITIGGPVSTGLFQAAAGTDFTTGTITAQQVEASAGGLATINGIWSAQFVNLISGDIDIGASGGIEGDSESSVVLQSTNGEGALIGDGLSGSGYRLTNAEFGRISAGELTIVVGGALGAAADTLLGDLDITGPFAGSTIESSTGGVTFVTLDEGGESLDGTLRIVGEVNATGFGDDNYLSFQTEHFELDAATGLLNIEGAQGVLGGQLWITAQNIHVASGDILDQLAEDPQYDGYQEDLNAPAAVERPDGVIRARTMDLEFIGGGEGQPNTLYVQNTGTSEMPAGFVITDLGLDGDGEGGLPPNSLDVIINGQIETGEGSLTGVDVRDALVESEGDLTPFTSNSTVNGCLLVGACVQVPEPPIFPPDFTPTPGIQDEVVLIGDDPMPPPPFGNEDVIDDNDEETEDTSPIVPPQPLFDTSELGEAEGTGNPAFNTPMRSNPGLTQEGDVDDPVSGSGNPALMETPPPTGSEENQQ